jgi:hypothetical protein
MPVQDSLNFTSGPYYDDFSELDNFYRVLFRPSYAVQARELTQSQTILQDQITKLANTSYSDGDLVSGGGIVIDTGLASIKLENQFDSVDLVANAFQNTVISGASDTTGTARAYVVGVVPRDAEDMNTLIVRYFTDKQFGDGITVSTDDDSEQATTTSATGPSKIPNASNVASLVSVQESVYYMSGFLNYVPEQYLVLEKYSSAPDYSVGFYIDEIIVDENDANTSPSQSGVDLGRTLLDPANGSYNFNAPGATRYRQKLVLSKREYRGSSFVGNTFDRDANTKFLELFRIANGVVASSWASEDPVNIWHDTKEYERKSIKRQTLSISQNFGVKGTTNAQSVAVISGEGTSFTSDFKVGDIVYLSNQRYYGNGTVSTNGTGFITGTNTQFLADFDIGKKISISNKDYEIVAVSNDTQLYVEKQTEKYLSDQPYIVSPTAGANVVAVANDTQMTLNALVGDGTTQNIVNSNTYSLHIEPGIVQLGNTVINYQRTETLPIRAPRELQYLDKISVGLPVQNYFLCSGIGAPNSIDAENLDQVLYLHTCISPNTASQTQLGSTVMATARMRDFIPYNIENVDQGKNEYATVLWNIKPQTLANTIGSVANLTFISLNGPTASLDDAYNGVTVEFTSGALKGQRTKIETYYQNTSCVVSEMPNEPLPGDGYRFIYQAKDVKAICVHDGLSVPTRLQISANNGVDSQGGSVLLSQSQESQFLYELPFEVSSIRDENGVINTKYVSRKVTNTNVTGGVGLTKSLSVSAPAGFTFTEYDNADVDAKKARELFAIFVTGTSDTLSTPVGNSLNFSSSYDTVSLSGGGSATKAKEVTFTIQDAGSASNVDVYFAAETETAVVPKQKTLFEGQSVIVTDPNKTVGLIDSLQTIDVFRIRAILDSQVDASGTPNALNPSDLSAAATGSSLSGANTVYVTQNYEMYSGMEDNYYEWGGVKLIGEPPTGQIGIIFDYFRHVDSGGSYFCIDSYPNNIARDDLPVHVSATGKQYSMSNCLDFRPQRNNLGISSAAQNTDPIASETIDNTGQIWTSEFKKFPSIEYGITTSVAYYTARNDTIKIDSELDIEKLEGSDSAKPYAPIPRKSHYELTDVTTVPFSADPSDIRLMPADAETNPFYDLAVNFANQNMNDGHPNTVFSAFDNFEGHGKSDIDNIDFAASVDTYEKTLHPKIILNTYDLEYSSIASKNVDSYPSLIVAEAVNDNTVFTNPYYTNTVPLNPFGRSAFRGQISITPQFNNWMDDTVRPSTIINTVGENDVFEKSIVPYKNAVMNLHQFHWYGVHSIRLTQRPKTSRQYGLLSDDIMQPVAPVQFTESIGGGAYERDLTTAFYMPKQTVYFSAEGMKAHANLFVYFDNERIDKDFIRFAKVIKFDDENIATALYNTGEEVRQAVSLETAVGIVVAIAKPSANQTSLYVIQTSDQDFSTTSVDTVDGQDSGARGQILTFEPAPTSLAVDQFGIVAGAYDLPAGRFTATDKVFRITNADDTDATAIETTFAETTFYGKPFLPNNSTTRETLKRRADNNDANVYYTEVERQKTSTNFKRCFAQEIYVDPSDYPRGLFLTGGFCYVANSDSFANTGLPLKISMRPMVDGFPSPSETLPFSEVLIQATEITQVIIPDSANDDTQTAFTFLNPVFCKPGKAYALCFDSDNPEYRLHMSRVGETLLNEEHRVPRFKHFLGLWRTNNHGRWDRDNNTTLTIDLHRAKFYNTPNSAAFFNVKDFPTVNAAYDNFYVRSPYMTFGNVAEPGFTYRSTSVATGTDLSYTTFRVNENYNFNVFGREGQQRVMANDSNTFVINVSMQTWDDRVSPVLDKDQMKLITTENIINDATLVGSDFIVEEPGLGYDYDTTASGNTNATIALTGGETYANGLEITVAELVVGPGGRVLGVNVTNQGTGYTGNVTATVLQKSGSTPPSTVAIIRAKSELDPYKGNCQARYISKIFDTGANIPAKGLRVMAEGVRPGGTDVHVYFRAVSGFSKEKIYDAMYHKLEGTQNKYVYGDGITTFGWETPKDFIIRDKDEIVYDTYSTFQVKVVFTSADSTTVPYLKSLRFFAFS